MSLKMAWLTCALMLLASAVTAGCGNACDDAKDHAEECGKTADVADDCSGAEECKAECIVDAECEAIDGTDPNKTAELYVCEQKCGQ